MNPKTGDYGYESGYPVEVTQIYSDYGLRVKFLAGGWSGNHYYTYHSEVRVSSVLAALYSNKEDKNE